MTLDTIYYTQIQEQNPSLRVLTFTALNNEISLAEK